ncbi:MAG: response regulator [Chthoniobacteraceae bacterium]
MDESEIADFTGNTESACPDGLGAILVVDDELPMRQMVSAMLRAFGCRVVAAADGEEALRAISALGAPEIDMLLTDYRMPGMLGDELAKRFHEAFPAAGIIVMSGAPPEQPFAPPCEFLAKPFGAGALRKKMRAVMSATEGAKAKLRDGQEP